MTSLHFTYQVWDARLQGRNREHRKHSNNTVLQRRGDDIAMTLHATDIVVVAPDGLITLNSGGWQTVTTKRRMNLALIELGARQAGVSQQKHEWYFRSWNPSAPSWFEPFYDGMRIRVDANGLVDMSLKA
jgi:hypothetical protein